MATPTINMNPTTEMPDHASAWTASADFEVDRNDPCHLVTLAGEITLVNTSANVAWYGVNGGTRQRIYGNNQFIGIELSSDLQLDLYSSEANTKPFVTLKLTKKGDEEL
jgi:hypothetical protein